MEGCFLDLVLVDTQEKESTEDEKGAHHMQQECQRTGNSCSGAGKKKRKPAKQTTTGAELYQRKVGPRKPDNIDAVSNTASTKPAGKA